MAWCSVNKHRHFVYFMQLVGFYVLKVATFSDFHVSNMCPL